VIIITVIGSNFKIPKMLTSCNEDFHVFLCKVNFIILASIYFTEIVKPSNKDVYERLLINLNINMLVTYIALMNLCLEVFFSKVNLHGGSR